MGQPATSSPPSHPAPPVREVSAAPPPLPKPSALRRFFKLRDEPSLVGRLALGAGCLLLLLGAWTLLTLGPAEARVVSPAVIGSPAETFGSFKALWFDRALTRNLAASLWRVIQGFGLAALVGVPMGILCGAWPRVNAFLAPISVFGRNVPISALVPLTLLWFGIEELQKVMFIFVACVMFVVFDA
ncbi:MAG: ABC transporter permease, partial [Myxococcales bacterium]